MKRNIVNIATLSAPKVKPLAIPGIGTVCIKPMNARALLALNEKKVELGKDEHVPTTSENIKIAIIILSSSLCDEEGALSYTEETKDNILDLPMLVLQSLIEKALPEIMKINGMEVEAQKSLKNDLKPDSTTI
jgi:hypothetical protein